MNYKAHTRPNLEEYENLYLEIEDILHSISPDLKRIDQLLKGIKRAILKVGLNEKKDNTHLDWLNRQFELLSDLRNATHQPTRYERPTTLLVTYNELDRHYLDNSPLKKKSERVITPLSKHAQDQKINFERKYAERKQIRQHERNSRQQRKASPMYSMDDFK